MTPVTWRLAALSAAALAASAVAASTTQPQLFLSPSPSRPGSNSQPVLLTAPQANAVLAHHLGIAHYEHYPPSSSHAPQDHQWEHALADPASEQSPKLVIMLECGSQGCGDLIPESLLASSQPYLLPNLPLQSWTAVLTLHLHRLANSLGLDVSSDTQVWGLSSFVEAIKSVEGWVGWVGEELGAAIGWDKLKPTFKAAVEPILPNSGLLTDLDLLGESSKTLVLELESLASLADSLSAPATDDGPQSSAPQIIAVRLRGVASIGAAQRARAALLARQTLSATLAAFHRASPGGNVVLLALPPYSPPLLRKRTAWLKPFHLTHRYARRTHPSSAAGLHKRQFDEVMSEEESAVAVEDEGRIYPVAATTPTPVVPSSSMCFASPEDVNNQTASCLGRGVPVLGVTVRGGECWVCSCGKTEVNGKVQRWAGEGCEKEDLSSDFNLLFFSGFGLILILLVSVMLLASVGAQELPGTLASVSGAGPGSHRD